MRGRFAVGKEHPLLWTLASEAILFCYIFFIVPPNRSADLLGFFWGLLEDNTWSWPADTYYCLPPLIFFGIVIIYFNNNRIGWWLLGTPLFYIGCFIYIVFTPTPMIENSFGLWPGYGLGFQVVAVVFMELPFWCIFFFLWELLFCVIAKWWRRKREKAALDEKDNGVE